jgi:ribonuclease P protein component
MLAKKNRMKRDEFSLVWEKGRRYHTAAITLVYVPSKVLKLSVVVGKKIQKSATERNKVRRRVYGIVESLLPFPYNIAAIIIIKKEFTTLSRNEQKEVMKGLFAHSFNLR